MISIAVSLGMAVMDSNIVNVALPTIADNLGISAAESVWVVNAYLLAVAVTLLPLASLGDIIGYRRIYRTGLVAFTLASLVCTFSDSLLTLTVARFFQGLGAAGIMSVNAAQVRLLYPSRLLGRGIGVTAMVVALSSGIGPTVAAGVLAFGTWPWLFALNIPLGVLALLLTARNLPAMPGSGGRFDIISAVLNALGIGLLVMAIDSIAHRMNPALAIAGVALAIFVIWRLVRRQLSRSAPLLPVDLLRIRQFRLAISAKTLSFTGQMAAFIALPFLLHDVLGYSAVETGLLMTPWPAAIMVVAPPFRMAGGSLPKRTDLQYRSGDKNRRAGVAGMDFANHAPACRSCLHGTMRTGLRAVPVTEQPRHHRCSAGSPQRRRGRHAGNRAAARPDSGRRPDGAGIRARH